MGIWAGIKHALNSTLGTKDFKPLDKMINDLIVEQTRMVASDNLYYTCPTFTMTLTSTNDVTGIFPEKYKMTRYGTVRFKGEIDRSSEAWIDSTFIIYKNDLQIFYHASNLETTNVYPFTIDIPVVPGDVISFEILAALTKSNYQGTVKLTLSMYGDVVPFANVFLTT